ncbi:MAG: DUF1559 domain-containing protein [Fimbriiglobus sp.]
MFFASRKAATLLELLIVIAILAVMIGLLLPAIQKVRGSALRMQAVNHLRQISIAEHNWATDYGQFPRANGAEPLNYKTGDAAPYHVCILKYIEQHAAYFQLASGPSHSFSSEHAFPIFYNPLDPSFGYTNLTFYTSFSVNILSHIHGGSIGPNKAILDGTSNTLSLAERFRYACGTASTSWADSPLSRPIFDVPSQFNASFPPVTESRGPGFAGPHEHNPLNGFPNFIFQVAPKLSDCDPRNVQASQPCGLLVAMCDGSVRTLGPNITPHTYWSLVTPAGGEVISEDW